VSALRVVALASVMTLAATACGHDGTAPAAGGDWASPEFVEGC
jgi:hypothetical protein